METQVLAIVVSNIALIAVILGSVVSIWIHQSNKFDKIHDEIMKLNVDIAKQGGK